jgi:hypothetical protein
VPSHSGLLVGQPKPDAVMWTLVALISAGILVPTLAIIGLFHFGALKRAEDLRTPPEVDRWASSRDLQTPESYL